jgi:hypothetical protein
MKFISFIIIMIIFLGGRAQAQLPSEKPISTIAPEHLKPSPPASTPSKIHSLPGDQKTMPVVKQKNLSAKPVGAHRSADSKKLPGSQKRMKAIPQRPVKGRKI